MLTPSFWLCLLASFAVAALLFRFTYRRAYERGYHAGRLDTILHRPDPLDTVFTRLLGMIDGFKLGLQHASKGEKVQKRENISILHQLN